MEINPNSAVKRLSDNAVFPVRCIEKPNERDFDILFQIFDQGHWKTLEGNSISEYTFYVPEEERRGLQLLMNF